MRVGLTRSDARLPHIMKRDDSSASRSAAKRANQEQVWAGRSAGAEAQRGHTGSKTHSPLTSRTFRCPVTLRACG